MEIEKIEGYVRCLLESWALHEDGEERVVWETLHDLLMAVSRSFTTGTGKTEGSGRFGLDYIPHDDYIARLHEGERVLTAQENQVWNMLQSGGLANIDYDTMGSVFRDNVKPGGNVYLNGRVVGQVMSEQQGREYRQLQRSGWQG